MRSAVYTGTLRHRRLGDVPHAFTYRVSLPYLDLAEVDEVAARHPLWSVDRPNVVSIRRTDLLDARTVRELVGSDGPVAVLGHVRTWGALFNPLAIYTCGPGAVLQVTNMPWHERHTYVVPDVAGERTFAKAMHVSPFLPMALTYRLRMSEPGESLSVALDALAGDEVVFEASLALRRRAVDRRALGEVLRRSSLATSARIYAQAASLLRRGAPVHRHARTA